LSRSLAVTERESLRNVSGNEPNVKMLSQTLGFPPLKRGPEILRIFGGFMTTSRLTKARISSEEMELLTNGNDFKPQRVLCISQNLMNFGPQTAEISFCNSGCYLQVFSGSFTTTSPSKREYFRKESVI